MPYLSTVSAVVLLYRACLCSRRSNIDFSRLAPDLLPTCSQLAQIQRLDSHYIPSSWLSCLECKLWPSREHNATVWMWLSSWEVFCHWLLASHEMDSLPGQPVDAAVHERLWDVCRWATVTEALLAAGRQEWRLPKRENQKQRPWLASLRPFCHVLCLPQTVLSRALPPSGRSVTWFSSLRPFCHVICLPQAVLSRDLLPQAVLSRDLPPSGRSVTCFASSGRSVTTVSPEMLQRADAIVRDDRRITTWQLKSSVQR
jgi:hypothetical protein